MLGERASAFFWRFRRGTFTQHFYLGISRRFHREMPRPFLLASLPPYLALVFLIL